MAKEYIIIMLILPMRNHDGITLSDVFQGMLSSPSCSGMIRLMHDLQALKHGSTAQELDDRFSRYGKVREARIVRNPRTGESRGFGFVMMEVEEDVDQVSFGKTSVKTFLIIYARCMLSPMG